MAEITDDYIMTFGDKKGQRIGDISNGYLTTLYDTQRLSKALRTYLENRIPILAVSARIKERSKGQKDDDLT